MKRYLLTAAFAGMVVASYGQAFDVGSNGSHGALNVTTNTVLELPPDGKLHFTTVNVAPGITLGFRRNAINSPVQMLAQGDIVINGTIDISGQQAPGNPPVGGLSGPGGFDGGKPGFGPEIPPGDGYGPGAGGSGTTGNSDNSAGGGSYGDVAGGIVSTNRGATYGSALLIPLIGGSGGGGDVGQPGNGGGGGGGAILIASNTRIEITGRIQAAGGIWRGTSHSAGSGGAVRVLAPKVEGAGTIHVHGGGSGGGNGRIRVDTLDKTTLRLNFEPVSMTTVGANMFVFPGQLPTLRILEAAGQAIPAGTLNTVRVQLPFGSDTNRTVRIQAQNFNASGVPIRVTLTPDSGKRTFVDTTVNNPTTTPGEVTVPIALPANTLVTIQVWTR